MSVWFLVVIPTAYDYSLKGKLKCIYYFVYMPESDITSHMNKWAQQQVLFVTIGGSIVKVQWDTNGLATLYYYMVLFLLMSECISILVIVIMFVNLCQYNVVVCKHKSGGGSLKKNDDAFFDKLSNRLAPLQNRLTFNYGRGHSCGNTNTWITKHSFTATVCLQISNTITITMYHSALWHHTASAKMG